MTHDALLREQRQILDGLLRVVRAYHVVAHRRVHVQHDVDAPAVLYPGREVGVVHRGGAPEEGAVAGLAAERLVLLLVAAAHDLDDLAVRLREVVLLAVDAGPGVEAVQRLSNAAQGGIRGLEDVPFFELYRVLLVHVPGALEEGVPVVLLAVFLLDEGDGVLQHLGAVGVRARLVVYHRHGDGEVGQAYAAALEHTRRLAGVAGHVRREHGLADEREVVLKGDARLSRAAGADVRREAEALGDVYIVRLQVLVNVADDELGQGLQRDGDEVREAGHEEGRHDLVHRDQPVGQRAAAEPAVIGEDQSYLLRQALDYGVHVEMSDLQLGAAEALEEPVYEAEGAEVGAHPAVLPHALEHRQGCAGDHEAHALEVVQPGEVVHHGVVYAAPLAVFGDAGLVIEAAAQAAGAVLRLPLGVEFLQFLVHKGCDRVFHLLLPLPQALIFLISRLSTKAWNLVRSWPTEPSAYSFSMVQQGTPISLCRTKEPRTFS